MEIGHGAAEGIRSGRGEGEGRGEAWKTVAPTSASCIGQAGALHLSSAASLFSNPTIKPAEAPPLNLSYPQSST